MTSDVSEVLLPCPFCNGDDVGVATLRSHFCVQCGCEANGPWRRSPESAITAWNTRAQPAVPAVPGWRPIDEAPKDGSLFLGCTLKGVVQIIKRNKYLHIWVHYDGRESARTMAYYMPLPAAPTIHADHVPDAGKMIHEGGEG